MSTISDKIMRAAMTLGDQRLMATHNRATREDVREAETDLRELITAALEDAERKGAEAMREAAAAAALENRPIGATSSVEERAIRALPLPTGQRQAVPDPVELLRSLGPKPWETSPEAHAQARLISDFADALANSLEVRRG